MTETADDSNEEVGNYQFIPDAHACDICQGMEGVYEDAPHIPVHPNCACQIVRLAADDANCEYEIRNLLSDQENYTEGETVAHYTIPTPLPADTDATTDVDLGVIDASGDEGVLEAAQEKFGWSPRTFHVRISQTLPAGTVGPVDVDVEFEMSNTIYEGERWRVCSTPNADGSTTLEETNVGSVGGIVIERTGVETFDIHAQDANSGGGYFESEDESPT